MVIWIVFGDSPNFFEGSCDKIQVMKKTGANRYLSDSPQEGGPDLVQLYRQMLLIRRFEEACAKAYSFGKIGGFLHLYIGQEAVAVGAMAALLPQDSVVATYREHGHAIARGMGVREAMAELYGKETGCSKGHGGSMHLFDRSTNFLGGYGIVGGHVPIAAGAAFAHKYKGDGGVSLCFFGDGAANMGAFQEGLSLASLWELPCVFICENNKYSMGTPLYRSLSVQDVSLRAVSHGIPHERVLGDDVLRIYRHVKEAVELARNENTPTLIEVETYRFRGHSMSDPAKYRTKDELDAYMKSDPMQKAKIIILEDKLLDDVALSHLEEEVDKEVADAVTFAEQSPEPDPESFGRYVMVD